MLTNVKRNLQKVYRIMWGQTRSVLRSTLRGLDDFETKSKKLDALWLIDQMKKATTGIDSKDNPRVTLHDAVAAIYKLRQGETESNDLYLERFISLADTVELANGANIFCTTMIMDAVDVNKHTNKEIYAEAQKSKAILLLNNADPKRYGDLSKSLKESTYRSRDEYPLTVSSMFELMSKHARLNSHSQRNSDRGGNTSSNLNNSCGNRRGGRGGRGFMFTQRSDSERDSVPGVRHVPRCIAIITHCIHRHTVYTWNRFPF